MTLSDVSREIRELWAEVRKYRTIPVRVPMGGGGGGGGTTGTSTSPCNCGDCIAAGAIDACAEFDEAPTQYSLPLTGELALAFGSTVTLVHVSSCTWESDLFEDVDLGDGDHDYTFVLVFTGDGVEEAELTLEDET